MRKLIVLSYINLSMSNSKDKAKELKIQDKPNIEKLLEDKICLNCGQQIQNKPSIVFEMAPVSDMVVIKCDKCNNGKYKIIKRTVDKLKIKYDVQED